jgi:hypothetical protein
MRCTSLRTYCACCRWQSPFPQRLSPAQAAQLSELVEYLHIRIRELLASVKIKSPGDRVSLDLEQWQNLLDMQGQLADYLREIGEPHDEE